MLPIPARGVGCQAGAIRYWDLPGPESNTRRTLAGARTLEKLHRAVGNVILINVYPARALRLFCCRTVVLRCLAAPGVARLM